MLNAFSAINVVIVLETSGAIWGGPGISDKWLSEGPAPKIKTAVGVEEEGDVQIRP